MSTAFQEKTRDSKIKMENMALYPKELREHPSPQDESIHQEQLKSSYTAVTGGHFCLSLCLDLAKVLLLPAKNALTVKSSSFGKYTAFCKPNKRPSHLNMWFWKNLSNSILWRRNYALSALHQHFVFRLGLGQAESCWAGAVQTQRWRYPRDELACVNSQQIKPLPHRGNTSSMSSAWQHNHTYGKKALSPRHQNWLLGKLFQIYMDSSRNQQNRSGCWVTVPAAPRES